jgi:nucleoside-diphosphate-sugar epimerase
MSDTTLSSLMHSNGTTTIQTVEQLELLLSEPSEAVVDLMRRLKGDIVLLGVGGKIGPSLARMARRATELAGVKRRITGVSRFSSTSEMESLARHGVETIRCDLLDETALAKLPSAENLIYLAGLKFGSSDRMADTWAMNAYLPGAVCRKFRESRIVAYSTGAIYGLGPITGSRESDAPEPVGEYAMSCLGRERVLEYFSKSLSIPMTLIRLFYACELRYGVLVDLARKVIANEPIDLAMGYFNVIWQGDNNAMTLLALEHAKSPPLVLNVTGPEQLSTRAVATEMGDLLGIQPHFTGTEELTACIGDASKARNLFGPPRVGASQLIRWAADWVQRGNAYLDRPTHFEVRNGRY